MDIKLKWKNIARDLSSLFLGLTGFIFAFLAAEVANATTIRVHSGGGAAYTDSSSNVWSADYGWTSDDDHVGWYTSMSISGTNDPELFRYDRWDAAASPELQYAFTVPNGSYQVKLYFAEKSFNWVGARIFNVQMEGTTVFSNLDVYAAAGLNQALIKTATVTVSDGQLNIAFIHNVENPFVDAIEIVSASDSQAPTAPTNLTATTASSSQINLSWTASTDNVGVTNYLIERCQGSGCSNFAQITTTASTSYNDTGLSASTSYSYRIRATDAAGNLSSYSSTASATTSSNNTDTTPPSTPNGLVLIASSSDEIDLLWSASTDNVGVTGYRLERCQSAGCSNFTQISTPTATTYYDTGRSASTSYSYRVRAADAAGNLSGYSSVLTVTTLAAAGAGCD